eukprot:scaffold37823_cov201-Skeletonema_marinoi.AAC.11
MVLPECDGTVLKKSWEVYGQTKSAKSCLIRAHPISCRWIDKFGHIGYQPAGLLVRYYRKLPAFERKART